MVSTTGTVGVPKNAKNCLLEVLKNLGCSEADAIFEPGATLSSACHRATVTVRFPDGRQIYGSGEGQRRSDADIAAAQAALDQLHSDYPDLLVDWDEVFSEAQAGDALIKLSVYLAAGFNCAGDRSQLLQKMESDAHLAVVFDLWQSQNDPDLTMWGPNLSGKRKATLIEALLWQRYRKQVLAADATVYLQSMLMAMIAETPDCY